MSHVGILRWHSPKTEKDAKSWEKALNRGGKFKISMSTKVCSNHFAAGYCSDICRIPMLYMKGYQSNPTKRSLPTERSSLLPPPKARQVFRDGSDDLNLCDVPSQTPFLNGHDYDNAIDNEQCSRSKIYENCDSCTSKRNKTVTIIRQQIKIQELINENNDLKSGLHVKKPFSIDEIKNDDKAISLYTGLQNYGVFEWLYNRIKPKAEKLSYFKGETSYSKSNSNRKKTGPKRKLNTKSELFMTLIRLRLGLVERDLSYRFDVSQSTVSQVLSGLEKPSLAKAQAQTYSSYKSKNTWKKLLSITPCGTISFISKCYGGCASDWYITETCGILEKINPGDNLMADKGFNISDLLVGRGSKLIIPPFLKDKIRFTRKNCNRTSNIAKARIHVERAIARIKDFRILQGAIPVTMKDLLDDIFVICAAITNLAPPLVPFLRLSCLYFIKSPNQDKAFIFKPIMTARSSITRNKLRNMISARINDWKVKNIERLTQGVHGKVRSI
ncbi:uncharacterized protein LOC130629707 [Hydractinia symbiolongicarpus]|uniref:uncharacterized protein LOC130629707 n=1 Tax=Hydractinia symbiolongicarpus TaxID=13093 RepID=UPI00254C6D3C|nr:uncharacterized protein LOC130629707 [Hydractinia symbiolongicarpus]